MKIKIIKFQENIKIPIRNYYNDAGADVYLPKLIRLDPHDTKVINLGFGLELPNGYTAIIQDRSSLATKGLMCHMAPVDAGYTGPIHLVMTNLSDNLFILNQDERVAQIVILPVLIAEFTTDLGPERNNNNFGSTGEK